MHITCSQFWCYGDYFKFVIHVLIGEILFCGNFDVRFLIEKQKEYCKVWRRRHPHGKQIFEEPVDFIYRTEGGGLHGI